MCGHYHGGRSLEFLGTGSGLDKRSDPIEALRDRLKTPAEKRQL
jgi:hypothetical protein